MILPIAIAAGVLFIVMPISSLNENTPHTSNTNYRLAIVIAISTKSASASVKLPWVVFIMLNPIIGVTIYFMVGFSGINSKDEDEFPKC